MASPPPSEQEIRQLLTSHSYSQSLVPQLEAYLNAQVTGQEPYVADAVRVLIKHYQIFPETFDATKTAHAFLLAMLQYPSTDLLALKCLLVPPEPVDVILQCGDLLDDCRFSTFWKEFAKLQHYDSDPVLQQLASSSTDSIRQSILTVLALSYKEMPTTIALEYLLLENVEQIIALGHTSIERADDASVVFSSTEDNTKRQRVYQESVNFDEISNLLAKVSQ